MRVVESDESGAWTLLDLPVPRLHPRAPELFAAAAAVPVSALRPRRGSGHVLVWTASGLLVVSHTRAAIVGERAKRGTGAVVAALSVRDETALYDDLGAAVGTLPGSWGAAVRGGVVVTAGSDQVTVYEAATRRALARHAVAWALPGVVSRRRARAGGRPRWRGTRSDSRSGADFNCHEQRGDRAACDRRVRAALVRVAAVAELLGEPDAELQAGKLEATLRPMTTLSPSPAAPFMMRLYAWGVRRIQRDRRLEDSLATLCAEARALHGQLAERFGRDADAAVAGELAAQLADARVVLAGAAGSLVGAHGSG